MIVTAWRQQCLNRLNNILQITLSLATWGNPEIIIKKVVQHWRKKNTQLQIFSPVNMKPWNIFNCKNWWQILGMSWCWPCLTAPWDLRSRRWQREDRTCDKKGPRMTNQRLFNRPWTTQDTSLPPPPLPSLSRPTSTATHICRPLVAGVYASFCS